MKSMINSHIKHPKMPNSSLKNLSLPLHNCNSSLRGCPDKFCEKAKCKSTTRLQEEEAIFIFYLFPFKSSTGLKILILRYKLPTDQIPLYPTDLVVPCYSMALSCQTAGFHFISHIATNTCALNCCITLSLL